MQIHAALMEWRSGTHTNITFSADAYLNVYNKHKLLLDGIKSKNVRTFHSMMHRLYRKARCMFICTKPGSIQLTDLADLVEQHPLTARPPLLPPTALSLSLILMAWTSIDRIFALSLHCM